MTDLIARLSASTGPDRDLDGEIWESIGIPDGKERHCLEWCRQNGRTDLTRRDYLIAWAPEFTGSVDVALTLIPPDLYWILGKGRTRPDEPLFGAQILALDGSVVAEAESDAGPALTLCIAAMKVGK